MLNKYFLNLARVSADIAGYPIRPEWIYSQWAHETGNFTSNLTSQYHNLGGLTQTTPNDTPQPDGSCYYMQFSSFEDYAKYFGRYLQYYREDGIYNSQSIDDYVTALKHGGYFGDSLTNYLTSVKQIYAENFSYSTTPAGYNANTTGNEILQNSYGDLGNNTSSTTYTDPNSYRLQTTLVSGDGWDALIALYGIGVRNATDLNGNAVYNTTLNSGATIIIPLTGNELASLQQSGQLRDGDTGIAIIGSGGNLSTATSYFGTDITAIGVAGNNGIADPGQVNQGQNVVLFTTPTRDRPFSPGP